MREIRTIILVLLVTFGVAMIFSKLGGLSISNSAKLAIFIMPVILFMLFIVFDIQRSSRVSTLTEQQEGLPQPSFQPTFSDTRTETAPDELSELIEEKKASAEEVPAVHILTEEESIRQRFGNLDL